MKKVIKFKIGKNFRGHKSWKLNGKNMLCHSGVSDYFDIPDDAKILYLTISDKPCEESYMVKIRRNDYREYVYGIDLSIPNKRSTWYETTLHNLDNYLYHLKLDNFYVKAHYE